MMTFRNTSARMFCCMNYMSVILWLRAFHIAKRMMSPATWNTAADTTPMNCMVHLSQRAGHSARLAATLHITLVDSEVKGKTHTMT